MHRKALVPLFLACAVVFAFAVRATFLWRDFIFVYDQGRDALAVSKILHGDLTLIGPTTGLSGVFLGPFFYYLLAPLYLLGQGNPIVPAYAFVFIFSLAVIPIFYLARRAAGIWAGVLSVFFFVFSFVQFIFSRWLSNPTPLPLVSLLMFVAVVRALTTKKGIWFLCVGVLLGICLQLEAANAFFLIPVLITILVLEWRKKIFSRVSLVFQSMAGFALTLAPQLLFEIKHHFLSTKALIASFQNLQEGVNTYSLSSRSQLLFDLYAKGWFWRAPWREGAFVILVVACVVAVLLLHKKLFASQIFRILFVWFTVPLLFHLMYKGNHGNFWDYYIIGQYIPLYILVSVILVTSIRMGKGLLRAGSLVVLLLLGACVLVSNVREWFGLFVPYNERISLSLQLDAVAWVYKNARGEPFGVWAYTPSAQDDVYRYLFSYEGKHQKKYPEEHPESTKRMFLVVEDDPRNPKRRENWIRDMSVIGTVVAKETFGAVKTFEILRK